MSNEHVARLQKVGIGKESTAGTAVSVSDWIPKGKGLLVPKLKYGYDEGAYGNIDKNREAYILQTWSELTVTDTEPRDKWIGHFLMGAFGLSYPCVKFPIPGSITGTFSEGETVTESTSTATGVLRRSDPGGSSKALYIAPATGTFTGGQTLTGGTSGATATGGTIESPASVRFHVFRRDNTNNHVSYTIYGQDPVTGDERAAYCVQDMLELECQADEIIKFQCKYMGQPVASTSSQTPSYTSENPFLGKHITFKTASVFNSLDAASAVPIERLKLTITNKVEPVFQTGGATATAPTSLHNTEFEIKGDFTALYNATTFRATALAGTVQALRLTIANTGVTIGSAANPTIQLDIPTAYFTDWGKDSDNGKIVRHALSFTATYDTSRSMTAEALLANARVTTY